MANQKYTPVGFYNANEDTTTFFSSYSNLSVFFQDENSPVATTRPVDAIESNIAGLGSRDVRGQYKGVTWRLYVKLTAHDEANVQEMLRLFSEEDGLRWLVVNDGQSPVVQWRTQVRILGIERIPQTKNLFAVILRCANPIWKAHSDISRTRTLPVLTLSGKELNNATRGDPYGANTDSPYEGDFPWAGNGTPTFVPYSCGIYEATTNLLINGGFESGTTGWQTSGTNTIAQSQEQTCFGFDVCKVTYGNTASVLIERSPAITFGGATQHTASCWVYIPSDWDGTGAIRILITGLTSVVTNLTVDADLTKRNQWQRIYTVFTPDAGDLSGAAFRIGAIGGAAPTVGRFFYVDGAQVENQPTATPYVETDGATAARSAGRIQMTVESSFDTTAGWIAFTVHPQWVNTEDPSGNPVLFQWKDDANNFLELRYDTTNNQWEFQRRNSGGTSEVTVADTFARDAHVTVIAQWTATTVQLSVDGSAFVSVGNTHIPTLAATQCDIGSSAGATEHFDGVIEHFGCGTGTLTDAEADAYLNLGGDGSVFDPRGSVSPGDYDINTLLNPNVLGYSFSFSGLTVSWNTAHVPAKLNHYFQSSNGGNRAAHPTITFDTHKAKYTDNISDYKWYMRGFIVNRSPFYWNDLPVYLGDQSAIASRFSTTTLVKDTTISNQINLAGGITAGQTFIPIDTAVGGGLPSKGMAWIDSEQIYYLNNDGRVLTGVVRGIGGTTAATHADNAVINPSNALSNGNDCRVWVNNIEVDRYLVDWNTANTDVVVNVSMPARIKLTLAALVNANDDTWTFVEGVSQLPSEGYLACGNEVVYFYNKSGRSVSVIRGVHGTTDISHATSVPVYANPLLYVIGVGKATADAPLAQTSRRPAIQLKGSSNKVWKWGDQADDTSTIFYDTSTPDRTAQWVPLTDNKGNIAVPVRLDASATIATFKDDDYGEGKPPYNRLNIDLPQGVKAAASAITADWTPADNGLILELFGKDKGGYDKRLDSLMQSAAAAGRTYAPASALVQVGLKGRYAPVTAMGANEDSGNTVSNTSLGSYDAQGCAAMSFTLDQATRITHINLPLSVPAGSQGIAVAIFGDSSNAPAVNGEKLAEAQTTVTATSNTWHRFSLPSNFVLPAGRYWIVITRTGAASQVVTWYGSDPAVYPRGFASARGASVWAQVNNFDFAFEVHGGYERDNETTYIQSDQPRTTGAGARAGTSASFDKVILTLNDDAADPWVPYVNRVESFSAASNGLKHCNGTFYLASYYRVGDDFAPLYNTLSIDAYIAWGAVIPTSSNFAIHAEDRIVRQYVFFDEDGPSVSVPSTVTPSDLTDWLPLHYGGGTEYVVYIEDANLGDEITVSYRSAKV